MAFDHELKLRRAVKHLEDLDSETKSWLSADHYSVRYEFDLKAPWEGRVPPGSGAHFGQGVVTAYASAEQPPTDPISLLIGDALHNLRSGLDTLAYALAGAFTKPLTEEIARGSEFPIVGDEDRKGNLGVGGALFRSGVSKIQGWHPRAQAAVEGLQPYQRGNSFRSDPLWVLHDLDRVSKHRLLHTTVVSTSGTLWHFERFTNIRIGPGMIESLGGTVETDTPIGRIRGIRPIDPDSEMYVDIHPALHIAFGDQAPVAGREPVLDTLSNLYAHIRDEVLPVFAPFL